MWWLLSDGIDTLEDDIAPYVYVGILSHSLVHYIWCGHSTISLFIVPNFSVMVCPCLNLYMLFAFFFFRHPHNFCVISECWQLCALWVKSNLHIFGHSCTNSERFLAFSQKSQANTHIHPALSFATLADTLRIFEN